VAIVKMDLENTNSKMKMYMKGIGKIVLLMARGKNLLQWRCI
jgi:hypothetical protein